MFILVFSYIKLTVGSIVPVENKNNCFWTIHSSDINSNLLFSIIDSSSSMSILYFSLRYMNAKYQEIANSEARTKYKDSVCSLRVWALNTRYQADGSRNADVKDRTKPKRVTIAIFLALGFESQ